MIGLLPPAWAGLVQSLRAETTAQGYWQLLARQFPLEPGLTYLNAANVCPASRPVLDRHLELLRDFQSNPSFQNREKYAALEDRVRSKMAALLGVQAAEVALTRNTSEATNIVIHGLDLKAGDEVVITEHNHPSNNDAWKVRAQRDGIVVKSVAVPVPAKSAAELLDGLDRAVTPRTRVIAITHLTSTCGLLYPAREVSEIARRRNLWYHLDGAQTFGAMDVRLDRIGCDSYSTSMHKWPMGPLEAGLLFIKAARQKEVWPSIVTAGWSDQLPGARKFEVFGQRDNPRLAALDGVADFLAMVGPANVESRVKELTGTLKRAFSEMSGLQLKTNLEPQLSHGVVKVFPKSGNIKALYDRLWTDHRVSTAMTASGDAAGLRFSPHIYNTDADIARAIDAVRRVLA